MDATNPINIEKLCASRPVAMRTAHCRGCTNNCALTIFHSPNGRKYFVGNNCERVFSNGDGELERGTNLFTLRNRIVFERPAAAKAPSLGIRIGVPRILGMFETFPFWDALLTECGFDVVLSPPSDQSLYERGLGSVMSDNICFPAKLAHGHVADLAAAGVDRIFYPHVVYNAREDETAANTYNCPIVSAYGEVLRGSMGLGVNGTPPLDAPAVSFRDEGLLKSACRGYVQPFGVSRRRFDGAFSAARHAQTECRAALARQGKALVCEAEKRRRPLVVLAGRPYHADPLIEHQTSEILADLGVDVVPADVAAEMVAAQWSDMAVVSQWSYPNRLLKAAQWVAAQKNPDVQLVMITSFGCGPDAFIMDEVRDVLAAAGKIFTPIKVDDIASTGSVRLRLRSLVETLRWRPAGNRISCAPPVRAPVFTKKDRKRTFIAPYFADCYTPFMSPAFRLLGYEMKVLPPPDALSVEYGMQYTNNEVCYPAIVVIGDVVKAFARGGYDPRTTAVVMPQTGGQCRATSYVPLLKRALIAAGYCDVPVVAASTKRLRINDQPGFKTHMLRLLKPAVYALLYADAVARMYYRAAVRERRPGEALAVRDRFLKAGAALIGRERPAAFLPLLDEAVDAFNAVLADVDPRPRIALVGEIYLKYNAFSHMHIVDWMMSRNVEVVVPPLFDFFAQYFVNRQENRKNHLARYSLVSSLEGLGERWIGRRLREYETALQKFRLFEPSFDIRRKAALASEIVGLVNQYGEGWLIPAEIACLSAQNVRDVVCVQPFGCIANHVVAKGIERAIKRRYPLTNLLFLDFDAGASEVNVLNRLYFMVDNVKATPKGIPVPQTG